MKYWFYPLGDSTYILDKALEAGEGTADIRYQHSFAVGDIIFVYQPAPFDCIKYEMEVILTDLSADESNDDVKYWNDPEAYYDGLYRSLYCRIKLLARYDNVIINSESLVKRGLRNTISVIELKEDIVKYIHNPVPDVFVEGDGIDFPTENDYFEGALEVVKVNKYERNRSARDKCIELKGCRCAVCGLDFEEKYGTIGKGFIHIHHIVPISTIGKEYNLDIEKDLVPVCPNCHYMLHKKPDGVYSIDELKARLK